MPCGKVIETYVPKGFDYHMIKVKCGNTSPTGDPYLCDECAIIHKDTDWRKLAAEYGERYDEDY